MVAVFVFGGGRQASTYMSEGTIATAEAYDTETRQWTLQPSITAARSGCVAAAVGGSARDPVPRILLFGGQRPGIEVCSACKRRPVRPHLFRITGCLCRLQALDVRTHQWSPAGTFRSSRMLNIFQGVQAPGIAEVRPAPKQSAYGN